MTSDEPKCPFGGDAKTTASVPKPVPGTRNDAGIAGPSTPDNFLVADWVDPKIMMKDPYPTYERIRSESPVAWVPALNRFLVTTFEGCHVVENNQEIFTSNVSGKGATMKRALGGAPMLRKDDPEHAEERAPINPVLRPKNLKETWAPIFKKNAEKYLDQLEHSGPDKADLNRDYAAPVASQNLIDLLGLKDTTVDQMRQWSLDFIAGTGNVLDDPEIWRRCDQSQAEIDALLGELIPYYQRHPNASVASALANSGLPYESVASNVKLTVSGGMNEPQHMVSNMVWALSRHPGQRAHVLAQETPWVDVFNETVRWVSPIGMYPRQATQDTELCGVQIPAGSSVGVVIASANRDKKQFGETADLFDINRPKTPHLGFGGGPHLCAGNWAAKIAIGEIAVPLAYQRFPSLRVDESRTETWDGWVFRGLTSLPVTWEA